jgi:hypothetical protein
MYFWSETRELNMAKKYSYELYEIFNESNIVNYTIVMGEAIDVYD